MAKKISVIVAGSGEIREMAIGPGTTVREVMEASNLRNYMVSQGPDQPFLGAEQDLHQVVSDGARLYASTPAEAGVL